MRTSIDIYLAPCGRLARQLSWSSTDTSRISVRVFDRWKNSTALSGSKICFFLYFISCTCYKLPILWWRQPALMALGPWQHALSLMSKCIVTLITGQIKCLLASKQHDVRRWPGYACQTLLLLLPDYSQLQYVEDSEPVTRTMWPLVNSAKTEL